MNLKLRKRWELTLILKIITIILLAALSLVLPACLTAPAQYLSVNKSYSGKEVNMDMFGTLVVSLESDPNTAYSWNEKARISNALVIHQDKHQFSPNNDPLADFPGSQVWTFSAMQSGTGTISMDYRVQFMPDSPPADTFTLTVNVR
jgi:inhibitor of cysteine peptidase